MEDMHVETKLVHAGEPQPRHHGAVVLPIFQTAMFETQGGEDYHDIKYIRAYSNRTMGAPLSLELLDLQSRGSTLTLFIGDQKLANALVEAINKTCREHAAQAADIYELEQEPEGAA